MSPEQRHSSNGPEQLTLKNVGVFKFEEMNKVKMGGKVVMETTDEALAALNAISNGFAVPHPSFSDELSVAYLFRTFHSSLKDGYNIGYYQYILAASDVTKPMGQGYIAETMARGLSFTLRNLQGMNDRMLQMFCPNPVLRSALDWKSVESTVRSSLHMKHFIVDGTAPDAWLTEAEHRFPNVSQFADIQAGDTVLQPEPDDFALLRAMSPY
jgi:hypothetical protein